MNGNVPPTLIHVKASIFVARAVRGAMPNCNSTGTVMSEVLPVTTLTRLVRKKMIISEVNSITVKRVSFPSLGKNVTN